MGTEAEGTKGENKQTRVAKNLARGFFKDQTMLERDITKAILNELTEYGCFVWKHWAGPMSKRGVSDVLGCLPSGRALAVEVKRPGQKPTDEQLSFIDKMNRTGGLGFVASDVDSIRKELEAAGIKRSQQLLFQGV